MSPENRYVLSHCAVRSSTTVRQEEVDLGVAEPELLERVEGATDTGDHAVAASGR